MAALDRIDTIAIVMMENRSFDHMLGHMSLPGLGGRADILGLEGELDRNGQLHTKGYENPRGGDSYWPHLLDADDPLPVDIPHERDAVAIQMGSRGVTGRFSMNGFAEAYFGAHPDEEEFEPRSLGFFGPEHVPITRFLADEYVVCDHWFSSIPTSTQPNRAMGLSGGTYIDKTKLQLIPTDDLVLDWLDARDVRWRVYHDGLSFFVLFGLEWLDHPAFRSFEALERDLGEESAEDFPQVLFIEPSYQSAPHLGPDRPNDNHAPLPVRNGEHFLRQVYQALTSNSDRWARTLLIITYDEHGGFWDHVSPPMIGYEPPDDARFDEPFQSMGPRVPSLIVSPLAERGSVCHEIFDNTAILQLLGEKFGGGAYSGGVGRRHEQGIGSVSAALADGQPRADIPEAPPAPTGRVASVNDLRGAGFEPGSEEVEFGFRRVAERAIREHPDRVRNKYPDLLTWQREERSREPYAERFPDPTA